MGRRNRAFLLLALFVSLAALAFSHSHLNQPDGQCQLCHTISLPALAPPALLLAAAGLPLAGWLILLLGIVLPAFPYAPQSSPRAPPLA